MTIPITAILAEGQWWLKIVDYKVYRGNNLWRFLLVLLVVIAAMAAVQMGRLYADCFYVLRGLSILSRYHFPQ